MSRRPKANICPQCGKGFTPNNKDTKIYCSASCRVMAWREKRAPTPMERLLDQEKGNFNCMNCGKRYFRKSLKGCYCSLNCRVAAHRLEKANV